ncbi:substrate-binding domain-containing protein [Streptomyces sp. NPDC012510]|uniref:phosphorylase family protein n=1 Tax=Streptomyces sp. NPDC012510 TaxID=3364838 RepID=UPI0036E94161
MAAARARTAIIFTALPVEYEKVEAHLTNAPATLVADEADHVVYTLNGRVPWRVYLAKTGVGNTTTATVVSRWLTEVKPEVAFFVGIAAGRKDADPRDVVVAETVYEYQRGRQSADGFQARPRSWEPPDDVVRTAERVARGLSALSTYRIHFKPVASGDTVIDSPDAPEHRIIRTFYEDTAAIETEGAGFAKAAQSQVSKGLQWLLIRGISDLADGDKKLMEAANAQEHAALNAAEVAVRILRALDIEPFARPARTLPTLSLRLPSKESRPPGEPEPEAASRPVPPPPKEPAAGAGRRRLLWAIPSVAVVTTLALIALQSCGNDDTGTERGKPLSASATLPTCEKADTSLYIAASVDKSEPLRNAAKTYGHRSSDGRCVEVVVEDKNSGEAMRALTRGWGEDDGNEPDVWAPAGSSWLSMARADAKGEARNVFPKQAKSIVKSPLTVAMPKPMADVLDWPENQFSWKELAGWSRNAKGFWSRKGRGKPAWGDFRLGKTNPAYSTSGLNATIGAFYAATGTIGELTEARLDDAENRAFVESIEQSTVHYGETTLTFLTNLRRADEISPQKAMSYISAVTLEESTVAAYNAGYPCGALSGEKGCEKTTEPDTPLVSFYPTDGILYSDHPYIELNSMSEAKKQVAEDFLAHLRSPRTFDEEFARYGFRTHDGEVRQGSLLLDKDSGVVPDTRLDALSTPQDDVLLHLLDIWPSLRRHTNVLLVIDTSGSMNDEIPGTADTKLARLKQAEAELFGEFTGSDRVGLWKFSDAEDLGGDKDYKELVPIGPYHEKLAGGTRQKLLSENFKALEAEGATGLYDTLDAATAAMRAAYDPKAINAIVLLTDGRNEDNGSLSKEVLLERIRDTSQSQVRIFTIAYGNEADELDLKGRTVLQEIADAGSGQMYDARKAETIEKVITSVISNF